MANRHVASQRARVREPCMGRGAKRPVLSAEWVNGLSAINKNMNVNRNDLLSQVKEETIQKEE